MSLDSCRLVRTWCGELKRRHRPPRFGGEGVSSRYDLSLMRGYWRKEHGIKFELNSLEVWHPWRGSVTTTLAKGKWAEATSIWGIRLRCWAIRRPRRHD